jgi:hypothetical protein
MNPQAAGFRAIARDDGAMRRGTDGDAAGTQCMMSGDRAVNRPSGSRIA